MISGPIRQTWHSDGNRNSTKSVEQYQFAQTNPNAFNLQWLKTYAAYYIVTLLYNVFLISLYVVMACGTHSPCLTRGGHNITNRFEFIF